MRKLLGYYKSCFSLRSSIICSLALVAALCTIFSVLNFARYDVEINDNGRIINTGVYSKTVEDALYEAGIKVSEYDELSQPLTSNLRKTKKIIIKRAKPVILSVENKETKIYTTLDNVGEVLNKEGIAIDENHLLATSMDTKISEGLKIEIIPKVYQEEVEIASLPFETVKKPNGNMEKGSTRVSRNGIDGEKKIVYKVIKHNGKVLEKQVVGEEVTKKPISKVVEYGTSSTVMTSRGDSLRIKRELTCSATAYCLKGRTATGRTAQRGVVAVDPSVIPLGSKLYIQTSSGSYVYGYAVAADTGGAIRGNKVDLYMETRQECINFGRRQVKVYILE